LIWAGKVKSIAAACNKLTKTKGPWFGHPRGSLQNRYHEWYALRRRGNGEDGLIGELERAAKAAMV